MDSTLAPKSRIPNETKPEQAAPGSPSIPTSETGHAVAATTGSSIVSAPESGPDPLPARRSRKGFFRLLGEVLDHGGPGYLQFAITNICNARCDFCNFALQKFDPKQRRSVTWSQARDVVDICVRNQIGYLLFVGGEPLVHKDLGAMVRYAAEQGINPMICSNGSLWTDQNMRALARHGLMSVIMSIDAPEIQAHEDNRGLPDVCRRIQRANQVFTELGVQTTASVTASKLIKDYEKLPDFLRQLGFTSCTFSYPVTTLDSSYLGFSDSSLVAYGTEELIEVFDRIKQLKQRHDFPIVNPTASLTDMQRHLRKEPERFGCLGGYKYFYLDWNLNLYRCHAWSKPMCSIYEFDRSKLIRDGCTQCMIDCYRDASVMQHVAVSLSDAFQALKKGRLLTAAKHLWTRQNWESLGAIREERPWIRNV
jgi:MoaA/NifB/PqqE/SkfB family radical SAM enzyme